MIQETAVQLLAIDADCYVSWTCGSPPFHVLPAGAALARAFPHITAGLHRALAREEIGLGDVRLDYLGPGPTGCPAFVLMPIIWLAPQDELNQDIAERAVSNMETILSCTSIVPRGIVSVAPLAGEAGAMLYRELAWRFDHGDCPLDLWLAGWGDGV